MSRSKKPNIRDRRQRQRKEVLKGLCDEIRVQRQWNTADIARATGLDYMRAWRYSTGRQAPLGDEEYNALRERLREIHRPTKPSGKKIPWWAAITLIGGSCAATAVAASLVL